MKNIAYIVATVCLFITGISALVLGYMLIVQPSGTTIGLSVKRLTFLPFKNFFIPGVLLFTVIGLSSAAILAILSLKWKTAPKLLILQGVVLIVWIIIQSMTVPYFLIQVVYGVTGVLLVITGLILSAAIKSEKDVSGKSSFRQAV